MGNYKILILFVFMVFCSCNKGEKTEKKMETKLKEFPLPQTKKPDSLFLSLSPYMSERDFEDAIERENEKRLFDGKFRISLEGEILNFDVLQENRAIKLNYSKSILENNLTSSNHIDLFNQLFEILDSQYEYHTEMNFPNLVSYDKRTKTYVYKNPENHLTDPLLENMTVFGFKDTNYAVFNDSVKTIVLSFSIKDQGLRKFTMGEVIRASGIQGMKDHNSSTTSQYNSEPNKPKKVKREKLEHDGMHMFQFTISVNYYLTKDFLTVKNKVHENYKNIIHREKLEAEEKEQNQERYKNRIEENKLEF